MNRIDRIRAAVNQQDAPAAGLGPWPVDEIRYLLDVIDAMQKVITEGTGILLSHGVAVDALAELNSVLKETRWLKEMR